MFLDCNVEKIVMIDENTGSTDSLRTATVSQTRISALIELSPEHLRLVADWLATEASDSTGAAMAYPERCDLALQSLAQSLNEFAHFKEGHIFR